MHESELVGVCFTNSNSSKTSWLECRSRTTDPNSAHSSASPPWRLRKGHEHPSSDSDRGETSLPTCWDLAGTLGEAFCPYPADRRAIYLWLRKWPHTQSLHQACLHLHRITQTMKNGTLRAKKLDNVEAGSHIRHNAG